MADIEGGAPCWRLQTKARVDTYHEPEFSFKKMGEASTIIPGLGNKKHFNFAPTKEWEFKPSKRPLQPIVTEPRITTKKPTILKPSEDFHRPERRHYDESVTKIKDNDLSLDKEIPRRGRVFDEDGNWMLRRPAKEMPPEKMMNRKKQVLDRRNGIPERTPGDKCFKSPEYVKGYYLGEVFTRAEWGKMTHKQMRENEIVALTAPSEVTKMTYREKQEKMKKDLEIDEVADLDNWKPVTLKDLEGAGGENEPAAAPAKTPAKGAPAKKK